MQKQFLKSIQSFLVFTLASFSLMASAAASKLESTEYQIEVLVYAHINSAGLDSERWPLYQNPKPDLNGVKSLREYQGPDAYTLVDRKQFRLNGIENKLTQSPDYQVLIHLAWRETLDELSQADSQWIHLYGGDGYDDSANVITNTTNEHTAYDKAAHWQVDGLFHIDVNRYFNTHTDLFFAAPMSDIQALSHTDNFASQNAPLAYFQLNQKRRMRSHELNLIGHPLYGVLIDIKKIHSA